MKLFNADLDYNRNLLPQDGVVNYFGTIFSEDEANRYFELLFDKIQWKNDEVIIFGKKIITKRKVAWYGDREFEYTYSKITRKAHLWTPELLQLKQKVETKSGKRLTVACSTFTIQVRKVWVGIAMQKKI